MTTDRRPYLGHHPIGASTGYMGALRGDWPAMIEQAAALSPYAVELSVLSEDEADGLIAYLARKSQWQWPFHYVSIHGPSKGRSMTESELVNALLAIADHADAIVMHPDTMSDPVPYQALGRKLVLENMDAGKSDGCTVEQLEGWFSLLPRAGFCFDVAHAWSLDPTMSLASDLLDAFRTRVRHVHLSSLSDDLHHIPLAEDDEALFTPLLRRCVDLPWILEAPPLYV